MTILCKECGNTMKIDANGISNHINDEAIDHNQDAEHTAILDESELNYISIYGFVTEDDLNNNKEKFIDAIIEDEGWEMSAQSIIKDNKDNYHHITVESDNGKPLPSFNP